MKLTRQSLFDDTITHFNSTNRSFENKHENGEFRRRCVYSGLGCAIGRHIEDKTLCKELDAMDTPIVSNDNVFQKLPQSLQELDVEFLTCIQQLHDDEFNWDLNGLSPKGRRKVETIRQEWKLELTTPKTSVK